MKNKGYYINLLGIIFGIISFLIIILSLTFIIRNRAYIRHRIRGLKRIERQIKRGFEKIDGEETVIGQYKNITVKNVAGHISISTWDEDYFLIKYIKTGPTFANIEGKIGDGTIPLHVKTTSGSIKIKIL